ncbi:MAG: SPASM domain-containing protein, partial [bacterium]
NLPLVKVNISTNADRLDPEISRHIIASELVSTLNIDLDGINRETAERIRPGTDFSKVMNNIHSLLEIKHGQSSPRVSITIIKMKDNRAEIDDFIDYWRNKVDQVEINSYNTWMGKVSDRGMEKNNHGLKRFDFPCEHPWNELVIASDGRSSLCCLDFDCQTVVGDANKDSLTEIWTGPKIDFYRKKLLKNDYRDIICEHCNAYIFQEDSFWRSIFL